jgi:hypothetical protein
MGSMATSPRATLFRDRPVWPWVTAMALLPALVKALCYPHNIGSDDAYIHLRIATNFIHGLGWGINPHQPVNLSSSPGFTLLLAAACRWTTHGIIVAQGLSCAAVVAGLILIYLAVEAETRSRRSALFAELAAALSVNLWRWNGALMEATFAFAAVAATLFLFRRDAANRWPRLLTAGLVLGICALLRPEMGILIVLAFAVQAMRSSPARRLHDGAWLLLGLLLVVSPWCWFAMRQFGSLVPTTFAAKSSSGLILLNPRLTVQFGKSLAESVLFPVLLVAVLLLWIMLQRLGSTTAKPHATSTVHPSSYILPAGWVVGLFAFYYLKTPVLQSTGRYVLPLLPCQAAILGLLWATVESRLSTLQLRFTAGMLAAQAVFAIVLNAIVIMPVLQRFEGQYGATMRAAADEVAHRTEGSPNRRVLVETDIGVLSCEANGRFEIYDGGALATPSLRGLSLRQQIQRVHPAYVIQSLASAPGGMGPQTTDILDETWERRFRQHGVSESIPFYYTVIFRSKQEGPLAHTPAFSADAESPANAKALHPSD